MFDSHAHLDWPEFYDDLDGVTSKMVAAGVRGAVNPAVDGASSRRALEISRRVGWVLPAVGIHPLYLPVDLDAALADISALADANAFCAVGEAGLDFWHGRVEEERQRVCFEAQIALAARLGLPLLLHTRKAFYEVAAMLGRAAFPCGGVFHAFSGSREMAVKALDLGFHLSACANITRPSKAGLLEVFRSVPRDRILVETDAPDMPPHFKRGETHFPWELPVTVAALAEALGMRPVELGELTERNARNLFGVE